MTDTKDDNEILDLDKEIADLEDLMNANDETLDDAFPLDEDEPLNAPARSEKQSGGAGKYLAYAAVLALLGGGGYAAYSYLPQMTASSELSQFEAIMQARSEATSMQAAQPLQAPAANPDPLVPQDSPIMADDAANTVPVIEDLSVNDPLPNPSDSDMVMMDQDNSTDAPQLSNAFGEMPPAAPETDMAAEEPAIDNGMAETEAEAESAGTIAEALEIAQEASDSADSTDMTDMDTAAATDDASDTAMPADAEANDDATPETRDRVSSGMDANTMPQVAFERIEAQPLNRGNWNNAQAQDEESEAADLPPLEEDTIAVAQTMKDMPADDLINAVEQADQAMRESIEDMKASADTPPALDETPTPAAQPVDTMDDDSPVMASPEAVSPQPAPQVVEERKAVPVKTIETPKAQPASQKKTPAKSAPKRPEDPRVATARLAMESNQYQEALVLYEAILMDNPANTAALTGKQLAQAKIRMGVEQMSPAAMPSAPMDADSAPMQRQDIVQPQASSSSVSDLLAQAAQNPRDARIALNVAEAYKAEGNGAQAMSWYRKALQLDIVYKAGLDRMAIYDAMAGL